MIVLEIYGLNFKICLLNKFKSKILFYEEFCLNDLSDLEGKILDYKCSNKIKTKKIYLIIKDNNIHKRFRTFPLLTKKDLHSVIFNNITDFFPTNIENYLYYYEVLSKDKLQMSVLISAVLKSKINEYLLIIKNLKCKCMYIDFYQNAISKIISKSFSENTFVLFKNFHNISAIYYENKTICDIRDFNLISDIKYNMYSFFEKAKTNQSTIIFLDEINLDHFFENYNSNIIKPNNLYKYINIDSVYFSLYSPLNSKKLDKLLKGRVVI